MRSIFAVAALVATVSAPALANVTFSDMNTGGIGETNVLFNTSDNSVPLLGDIDHTGVDVAFTSLTGQSLISSGNGQADIQVNPNPGVTEMTSIEMTAAAGTAWGDVIINMDEAGGLDPRCTTAAPCTAHITVVDNLGNVFHNDVLENGNNFVTAIADTTGASGTPEFITQLQVQELAAETNAGFGWTDFKQPRVSGACTLVPGTQSCTPIPTSVNEPATLGILGTALMAFAGLFGWRRRQQFYPTSAA